MADWQVSFVESQVNPTGFFRVNDLNFSIVNSDEGQITFEIPIGHPDLTPNLIGPYRTEWSVYRNGNILEGGPITSMNLNKDRQTVMFGGATCLHWMKRRIYPFDPVAYRDGGWPEWPVRYRQLDTCEIARRIVNKVRDADPYSVPIYPHNGIGSGFVTNYKIFPADPTTEFDHIKALSELGPDGGFEFGVSPTTLEFFMYPGGRDSGFASVDIAPRNTEAAGQIIEYDWNNLGPRGTWTLGLGSGDRARKMGAVKTDEDNKAQFGRLDIVEDFGEIGSQAALDRKTAFEGSTNLGPERNLAVGILNPETMIPNFYTGGRPRNLIGDRLHSEFDFEYRHVDAYFIVNALNFRVEDDGNEEVMFDLEMIPPRLA